MTKEAILSSGAQNKAPYRFLQLSIQIMVHTYSNLEGVIFYSELKKWYTDFFGDFLIYLLPPKILFLKIHFFVLWKNESLTLFFYLSFWCLTKFAIAYFTDF